MLKKNWTVGGGLFATLWLAGAAHAATISVATVNGSAGATVPVNVSLASGDSTVASLQVDIGFDPSAQVKAKANNKPDCAVNGDIDKGATSFAFRPPSCTVGTTCTAVRAAVLSTENSTAIGNAVVFTCNVGVAAAAQPNTFALTVANAKVADADGNETAAEGVNGGVVVAAAPTPTDTPRVPTATAIPPTSTPVPPTATKPPSTSTPIPTSTNTRKPSTSSGEDDGCQITAPAHSNLGWFLLAPAAVLLWSRRRSR